jgi:hypothetical protein
MLQQARKRSRSLTALPERLYCLNLVGKSKRLVRQALVATLAAKAVLRDRRVPQGAPRE